MAVAVGGYKAEAGNNGELMGAVHEVPGLVPAPALNVQKNSNGGALTVGTSAFVTHSLVKREAEADPALLYGAYGHSDLDMDMDTMDLDMLDTMDTHMEDMLTTVK